MTAMFYDCTKTKKYMTPEERLRDWLSWYVKSSKKFKHVLFPPLDSVSLIKIDSFQILSEELTLKSISTLIPMVQTLMIILRDGRSYLTQSPFNTGKNIK